MARFGFIFSVCSRARFRLKRTFEKSVYMGDIQVASKIPPSIYRTTAVAFTLVDSCNMESKGETIRGIQHGSTARISWENLLGKTPPGFPRRPVNRPCTLYSPSKVLLQYTFILVLATSKTASKAVLVISDRL